MQQSKSFQDKNPLLIKEQSLAKTVPESEEAEKAVLGAVLAYPEMFYVAESKLDNGKAFFYLRHSYIWDAMAVLAHNNDDIDTVTVSDRLNATGHWLAVGGISYLTQLLASVPTAKHIQTYAGIVQRCYERRRMLMLGDEIKVAALDDDGTVEDILGKISEEVDRSSEALASRIVVPMSERVQEHADATEILQALEGGKPGIETGIATLDAQLGGFISPFTCVVVGRPHQGKTVFLMTSALGAAESGFKVAYFNVADGTEKTVMDRFASMLSGVPAITIATGNMTDHQNRKYLEGLSKLGKLPIFMSHKKGMTMREILMYCKVLKATMGLDIIMVDYFQRISIGSGVSVYKSKIEQYDYFSQRLTVLSEVIDAPVIYGAQAKREVETRGDKRPLLSDVEYCGRVEQDCDVFISLYKASEYNDRTVPENQIELVIRKNKMSTKKGTVFAYHHMNTGRL